MSVFIGFKRGKRFLNGFKTCEVKYTAAMASIEISYRWVSRSVLPGS